MPNPEPDPRRTGPGMADSKETSGRGIQGGNRGKGWVRKEGTRSNEEQAERSRRVNLSRFSNAGAETHHSSATEARSRAIDPTEAYTRSAISKKAHD